MQENKQLLPSWFPVEHAREALKASYPFHPSLLSVFERKWQGLPRFQQTRGVLRLLALWVSKAYAEGYKGAHKDPLISLGTAPVEDPIFRAALFEQLGEARLEPAVTTDIAGKDHAHALRLDAEATTEVRKARLHRKVATSILFESNGGQQRGEATQAEVRLAVAEPGLTIGSVEQCLESLADSCYYLNADRNRYRFSFQPNLNKLLADRRASVGAPAIEEKVRAEIQKVFAAGSGIDRVYFPHQSNQVPDRAILALVVLPPENSAAEPATRALINTITTESGSSSRTFKSALIWSVAEDTNTLREEARKLLAWKDIEGDADELKLDDVQQRQLAEYAKRAERDLREAVWRAYKNLFLLAEDNSLRHIDLGLVHSSTATTMVELILSRLGQVDLVVPGVTPSFLTRYWPPALPEWSTRSVRDAFYASPKFPRLLKPDAVKETISRGLDAGLIAYVGRAADGIVDTPSSTSARSPLRKSRSPTTSTSSATRETEEYLAQKSTLPPPVAPSKPADGGADASETTVPPAGGQPSWEDDQEPQPTTSIAGFTWTGEVSSQKWMNFYTKVLSRFATTSGLKLTLTVEVDPPGGTTSSKVEETKAALRDLGMPDDITLKR